MNLEDVYRAAAAYAKFFPAEGSAARHAAHKALIAALSECPPILKLHDELRPIVREYYPTTHCAFVYDVPVLEMTREELISCLCWAISKMPDGRPV